MNAIRQIHLSARSELVSLRSNTSVLSRSEFTRRRCDFFPASADDLGSAGIEWLIQVSDAEVAGFVLDKGADSLLDVWNPLGFKAVRKRLELGVRHKDDRISFTLVEFLTWHPEGHHYRIHNTPLIHRVECRRLGVGGGETAFVEAVGHDVISRRLISAVVDRHHVIGRRIPYKRMFLFQVSSHTIGDALTRFALAVIDRIHHSVQASTSPAHKVLGAGHHHDIGCAPCPTLGGKLRIPGRTIDFLEAIT